MLLSLRFLAAGVVLGVLGWAIGFETASSAAPPFFPAPAVSNYRVIIWPCSPGLVASKVRSDLAAKGIPLIPPPTQFLGVGPPDLGPVRLPPRPKFIEPDSFEADGSKKKRIEPPDEPDSGEKKKKVPDEPDKNGKDPPEPDPDVGKKKSTPEERAPKGAGEEKGGKAGRKEEDRQVDLP